MKLTMIVYDKSGVILRTQAMYVSRNKLKRVHGPGLSGEALYELQKDRKVRVQVGQETYVYTLTNGAE